MIAARASARVASLAALLRELNFQNDVTVAYKPLGASGFREVHARAVRLTRRAAQRSHARTRGSCRRLSLRRHRDPGRLVIRTRECIARRVLRALHDQGAAAVEVDATYCGFADEVSSVMIASDSEALRQFLPEPSTLKHRLLLAAAVIPAPATSTLFASTAGSSSYAAHARVGEETGGQRELFVRRSGREEEAARASRRGERVTVEGPRGIRIASA